MHKIGYREDRFIRCATYLAGSIVYSSCCMTHSSAFLASRSSDCLLFRSGTAAKEGVLFVLQPTGAAHFDI